MIGAVIARRKVSAAFDALNRRDLDGFLRDWSVDARRVFPGDIPASGTISGKETIREWYENFLRRFPGARFSVHDVCVKRLWDLTGNNVVAAHWDANLTNRAGQSHQNSGVTIITVKGGKVVRVRDYIFDTGEAFRDAWQQD